MRLSADVPFNPEPTKEGILQRLRDKVDGDGSTDEEDVPAPRKTQPIGSSACAAS